MEYDVVVVGAGPAGSMAAKYAAKAGASVLMIEEHETIGQPVQCAGLISTQAFEGCEVSPETVSRLAVRGANVHAPDGHVLKIDGRRTMAYVVDRGELDRAMALEALKSGAAALVKTRLNNFRRQQDRIIIAAQSQGDPIEYRLVSLSEPMDCKALWGDLQDWDERNWYSRARKRKSSPVPHKPTSSIYT